jgi:RimJ/RimL family protein N-acetyltransferase
MRATIDRWAEEDADADFPTGHWAVRRVDDGVLVGSVTLRRLPPEHEDLELAWQFAPEHWGHGYATEAARSVAAWAFENSAHELFAVTRPSNERAVRMTRRLGMQWVGETDKYYGLRLDVYRVRPPELLDA